MICQEKGTGYFFELGNYLKNKEQPYTAFKSFKQMNVKKSKNRSIGDIVFVDFMC